jgi:Icc-related predicted phosphoesterase
MNRFAFATDIHGQLERLEKLVRWIEQEAPSALLLGGDLLPSPGARGAATLNGSVTDYLAAELGRLQRLMGAAYPRVGAIMGNDDPRRHESDFQALEQLGLWTYLHARVVPWGAHQVAGYAFVPPTPFQLKDWEKYDVSRYVDPGCSPPTEGLRTTTPDHDPSYSTIAQDLDTLAQRLDAEHAIVLFHCPPHGTVLDRAALDGARVDHVPLDVHVGSIAVRRFIEQHGPRVTLHGHVHESVSLTGQWRQQLGRSTLMGAAHQGPELALVVFDPDEPASAERILL